MSAKHYCDLCNKELHLGEDHITGRGPLKIGEFEVLVSCEPDDRYIDLCRGCLRAIVEGKVMKLPEDDVRADDHDGPIEDLL